MMLSNPSLLLGPSSPSESHPCNPWQGISVLGKSRAGVRSRSRLVSNLVCRGLAEWRRAVY